MQCLTGVILVILLMQNSLGQEEAEEEDPACGEKPRALNTYMRRLNNEENETERPEDPKVSDDPTDPKSRMSMFSIKSQTYYPAESPNINIMPSASWIIPQGGHTPLSMSSSFFQYGISSGPKMNSFSHTLKYKVNIPVDDLLRRLMALYMKWPEVKSTLEVRHAVSFRDVLRAIFDCLYPEWGNMKMNMIFSGISDEAILKNLFLAMFPNWPQREIDDIFSPANTIPLIIRKLLLYLVPDLTQKEIDFIFSNTSSVKVILQRICSVLFPWMKERNDVYLFDGPVPNILDGLIQGIFPQMPPPTPIQLEPVYTILFPGITYNVTSSEPNLLFLLSQYRNAQSMQVEPSKRENILMLILFEWLKQNPHASYVLPSPGMDDFNNFKRTFFQNVPPNTMMPQEFHDDNFLKELFALWKRYIVERYPNDKQINMQGIRDFLWKFIQSRIINKDPNMQLPQPTFQPITFPPIINEIPNIITITFLENLKDILPPDMRIQLIELFHLPDKKKAGSLIMRLLANWKKNRVKDRVPLSKLMELILRIIASNWPDVDIERVVGRHLNLEQILINLFKVMFLEWPEDMLDENANKLYSPQFILEMFLKKALPHVPRQKIEAAFGGFNNMERVLRKVMKILYPNWPSYDPHSKHFSPEVLEKILSEIINWPETKAAVIAKGGISIPLLLQSFIHTLYPSWPQHILSMFTVGRTPLPLVVQKIIQMIAIKHEDKNLVLDFDEHSPMVLLPEALFRKIFPDWPNISAVLNIPIRRERYTVLGEILKVVHGPIIKHENSFKCLNDSSSNWTYALFIALLKYVEQESVLNSIKMF